MGLLDLVSASRYGDLQEFRLKPNVNAIYTGFLGKRFRWKHEVDQAMSFTCFLRYVVR